MTQIYPLILCGGNGTRLWPLSRTQSPKQFQRVAGPESMTFFQTAVQRHRGPIYADPCIVAGAQHRGTAAQQLREIQVPARILCEPAGRNTGPAVLAAAYALMAQDPEAVVVVVPADHVIEGPLSTTIASCLPAAEAGHIITFGVPPRYPETGFGYILEDGVLEGFDGIHKVGGFVEKPPFEEAERLLATGRAFWASGLSMFAARTIVEEYTRFEPETALAVAQAVAMGRDENGVLHLAEEPFGRAAALPTEQAVFERTDRIAFAPLAVQWDDVGSWRAMYDIAPRDADGNVLQGDVIARGARNTMVRADSRLVSIVGLDDVVVVDTPDALLVARMGQSQDIKDVVGELRKAGRSEAEHHVQARPAMVPMRGGALEGLVQTDRFHLGTAEIGVGKSTELEKGPATRQVIVVSGTVMAEGPKWSRLVREGDRVFADAGGAVRLVNHGDEAAEILFLTLEHPGGDRDPAPDKAVGHA